MSATPSVMLVVEHFVKGMLGTGHGLDSGTGASPVG